jgi:hypothetical protein
MKEDERDGERYLLRSSLSSPIGDIGSLREKAWLADTIIR